MATRLITHSDAMTQERFKQEAALIVLDRMMEAVAQHVLERFKDQRLSTLAKGLEQFEESRPVVMARVAESIADAFTAALGPVLLPEGIL